MAMVWTGHRVDSTDRARRKRVSEGRWREEGVDGRAVCKIECPVPPPKKNFNTQHLGVPDGGEKNHLLETRIRQASALWTASGNLFLNCVEFAYDRMAGTTQLIPTVSFLLTGFPEYSANQVG